MKKFQNYLKDVAVELKKVTWPSWEELKGATYAVIFFSLVSSAYVYVVDYGLLLFIGKVAEVFGT